MISDADLKKYIGQLRNTIVSTCEFIPVENLKHFSLFEKKQQLMQLQALEIDCNENMLVSWPLFFSLAYSKVSETHIMNLCAISFGALILIQSSIENRRYEAKEISNILAMAIKTLVFLRNDDGSWPSDFGVEYINSTKVGTINQTTLALATLAKLGFLDKVSPIDGKLISDEALKIRFYFISESINCLLNSAQKINTQYAWGHIINAKEISVLPTSNVINVLDKLRNILIQNVYLPEERNILCSRITEAINGSFEWLRIIQNDEGSFSKANYDEPSFSYTCLAASVLLLDYSQNSNTIQKAMSFLLRFPYSKLINKEPESEYYDKILTYINLDNRNKKKEILIHEIFVESIYALALINYSRECNVNSLKLYNIQNEINKMIKAICARKHKVGDLYLIKGRRETAFQYPIYCIYYSLITFKYYLNSYKKFKNINSTVKFLIIFLVSFALYYGIMRLLNFENALTTISSLVLSLLSSVFSVWIDKTIFIYMDGKQNENLDSRF